LSLVLPSESLVASIIPAISHLFVFGRLVYFIGYSHVPVLRAFGFSLTMGPSTVALSYVALKSLNVLPNYLYSNSNTYDYKAKYFFKIGNMYFNLPVA